MNELEQTINSREVAEMVGKKHNELLKDIRRYIKQLGEGKIPHTDFFMESAYKTEQNKTILCYDVTKRGCEFIAHKMTGTKGAVFTARYINRFHEMEEALQSRITDEASGKTLKTDAFQRLPLRAGKRMARQNWFNFMLSVLEKELGLPKDNMLHQAYNSIEFEGTNIEEIKVRYIEETGLADCSTFEAMANDRIGAEELADILHSNMKMVFIKRCL